PRRPRRRKGPWRADAARRQRRAHAPDRSGDGCGAVGGAIYAVASSLGAAGAAASCKIMSAPFSAIITGAAFVLPDTSAGMIDASTTRRRPMPRTRRRSSVTAVGSEPMRHVLVGWKTVVDVARANAMSPSSLVTLDGGLYSSAT